MDVTHYSRTVDCDGLSVQYDLYCPGKTQSENGKNETLTLDENLTYEQKVLAFEQAYFQQKDAEKLPLQSAHSSTKSGKCLVSTMT